MRRVVRPDGWIAWSSRIGSAARLKPIPFPEPYLRDYSQTDWDEAFRAAGFTDGGVAENANGWIRVGRAA